jgi:3-oxoacyl-[acyl-carrier protein] reductase
LTYSTNRTTIEELVASLKSSESEANKNLRISVHKVDLASAEEIENLFAEIKEKHQTHVDILVSNAGYGKRIVDISSVLFRPCLKDSEWKG